MRDRVLLVLALVAHLALQLAPAWKKVDTARNGRDFASYYYALQVAADGGDPYETPLLSARARTEHTRKGVHPFFYPPPFLLAVAWARPLGLHDAYRVMLLLNELCLFGSLAILVRSFATPVWLVALLLATYTPIPDNAWMGQANLLALLPALAGLALAPRRPLAGGLLVGLAAMIKMSPALFLLYWALRRQWRPIAAATAAAVALSVVTLPLVDLHAQLRFYTEVLPGFSSGDYHGLDVPISLPANHSIPDLFDRLWPAPGHTRLTVTAQRAAALATLTALALWAWRFRRPGREIGAVGALAVIMVIVPVYTYEHHLVFLLPALAGASGAGPLFFLCYFFLAWPLDWLREAQKWFPFADSVLRESKFLAEVGMALLCARRGSNS